jgi:alcohol dehydrogenase class IV
MHFEFATSARIVFGPGSIKEAGPAARVFGKRALLVQPQGRVDTSTLASVLLENGVESFPFHVGGEPTIDLVVQGIRAAREQGCDMVVSMGGGSAIDAGKAISAMLTNPGELLDYLEVVGKSQPLRNQAAPLIAIPTTAGTGSEVTRNAVLAVPEQQFKVSMRSPLMLPRLAIVDPELTYNLPPAVTASTGMDALAQVLEPYVSKKANPMVDLFCREGLMRAARSLRKVFHQGQYPEGREDMAWVSLLGGLSLANAGLGAVHGFAAPIGGQFTAPHGAVCARLLGPVVRANVKALKERAPAHLALERYQEIAAILTGRKWAEIEDGIAWLDETCTLLEIPPLRSYGMTVADISPVAAKAARASSMQANPIVLTQEELEVILGESI